MAPLAPPLTRPLVLSKAKHCQAVLSKAKHWHAVMSEVPFKTSTPFKKNSTKCPFKLLTLTVPTLMVPTLMEPTLTVHTLTVPTLMVHLVAPNVLLNRFKEKKA